MLKRRGGGGGGSLLVRAVVGWTCLVLGLIPRHVPAKLTGFQAVSNGRISRHSGGSLGRQNAPPIGHVFQGVTG
jgi:hypothetical protein